MNELEMHGVSVDSEYYWRKVNGVGAKLRHVLMLLDEVQAIFDSADDDLFEAQCVAIQARISGAEAQSFRKSVDVLVEDVYGVSGFIGDVLFVRGI